MLPGRTGRDRRPERRALPAGRRRVGVVAQALPAVPMLPGRTGRDRRPERRAAPARRARRRVGVVAHALPAVPMLIGRTGRRWRRRWRRRRRPRRRALTGDGRGRQIVAVAYALPAVPILTGRTGRRQDRYRCQRRALAGDGRWQQIVAAAQTLPSVPMLVRRAARRFDRNARAAHQRRAERAASAIRLGHGAEKTACAVLVDDRADRAALLAGRQKARRLAAVALIVDPLWRTAFGRRARLAFAGCRIEGLTFHAIELRAASGRRTRNALARRRVVGGGTFANGTNGGTRARTGVGVESERRVANERPTRVACARRRHALAGCRIEGLPWRTVDRWACAGRHLAQPGDGIDRRAGRAALPGRGQHRAGRAALAHVRRQRIPGAARTDLVTLAVEADLLAWLAVMLLWRARANLLVIDGRNSRLTRRLADRGLRGSCRTDRWVDGGRMIKTGQQQQLRRQVHVLSVDKGGCAAADALQQARVSRVVGRGIDARQAQGEVEDAARTLGGVHAGRAGRRALTARIHEGAGGTALESGLPHRARGTIRRRWRRQALAGRRIDGGAGRTALAARGHHRADGAALGDQRRRNRIGHAVAAGGAELVALAVGADLLAAGAGLLLRGRRADLLIVDGGNSRWTREESTCRHLAEGGLGRSGGAGRWVEIEGVA